MSPYKLRYYRTPPPDYDYKYRDYDYDYDRRYKDYDYRDYKRGRDYDNDSAYGETVYEYDSDYYARRVHSPPPRRHHHHHHHHRSRYRPHHHHHHHHQRRTSASYDHHVPHIHYISARSEPPMRYTPVHPQRLEVTMLKSLQEPHSEPRIALYDKRYRPQRHSHSHCNCHACPEKSSKAIPTMHYDELRCPHCAAHVQPAQDEILAYPWTAQSYRPAKKSRSLPPLSNGPNSQVSAVNGAPPTVLTYRSPNRQKRSIGDRETQSLVAPTKPLFRADTGGPTQTQPRVLDGGKARNGNGSYLSKTQRAGPPTAVNNGANDFDDIKPNDSISNVELPPLRAYSTEAMRNDKPRQTVRAETEVDKNYTREKYFRSMEEDNPPPQAQPTPRPAKDTASNISRMLKGEYYDRQNGQKYTYNVNYARRKVYSDRQPQR